jgi:predicted transcriptional regulator
MRGKKQIDWIKRPKNNRILFTFSVPKTPTQVKNELGIDKFNLKPYLKRGIIECLNPEGHKGKLYVLTNKARRLLKISIPAQKNKKDYDLIGWILASPRQRYVVLKTLSLNSVGRTSEEIRIKSSNLNPCLSRISTKSILKELMDKELVETEMGRDRKRYYWVNKEGKSLAGEFH